MVDRSRYGPPTRASGGGGGNFPENAALVTLEEGDVLEGVYLGAFKASGKMKSDMHYFTLAENDEPVKHWGNTVLDDVLGGANPGDLVTIRCTGWATSKRTGNQYRTYEVDVATPLEPGPAPTQPAAGGRPNPLPPRPASAQPRAAGGPARAESAGPRPTPGPARGEPESPRWQPDDDDIPF